MSSSKFEYGQDNKTCENCGIKYKDCEWCIKYSNVKNDLIECKYNIYVCWCCNKNYHKTFDENLMKKFANTYEFSNHGINKFILLLQKCVYSYGWLGKTWWNIIIW